MFCYQRRHLIVTSLPWALHSQLLPLSDGAVRDRTTKARPRHFMLFFLPPFFFLTLLEPLIEEAQPTFYSWFVEFLHSPSREVRQEMDGAVFPFLRKDHTGSPGRSNLGDGNAGNGSFSLWSWELIREKETNKKKFIN